MDFRRLWMVSCSIRIHNGIEQQDRAIWSQFSVKFLMPYHTCPSRSHCHQGTLMPWTCPHGLQPLLVSFNHCILGTTHNTCWFSEPVTLLSQVGPCQNCSEPYTCPISNSNFSALTRWQYSSLQLILGWSNTYGFGDNLWNIAVVVWLHPEAERLLHKHQHF